jgi:hypothetical protein
MTKATPTIYDADGVRKLLREACARAGSETAWAKENGLSQSYVNHVAHAVQLPGSSIADALGLEPVPTWRKKNAS